MSSMLEEAIIDAEALKEAAQKSAEEKIIEHFSKDIKEAVDIILEQDAMAINAPGYAATMAPTQTYVPQQTSLMSIPANQSLVDIEAEGEDEHEGESIIKQTPYAATTSDRDIVSIDLDKLEEAISQNLQEDTDEFSILDESFEIDDDLLEEDEGIIEEYGAAYQRDDDDCEGGKIWNEKAGECIEPPEPKQKPSGLTLPTPGKMTFGENLNLEEMIRNILAEESIGLFEGDDDDGPKMVDPETACKKADRLNREKKGRSWTSSSDEKDIKEAEKACAEEEAPTKKESRASQRTLKEHKQLNNKVKLLEQKLDKYQEVFPQLKERLEESNLQNARLHYQNRVLNSASLNERQKDRLVETISKANTVEEAKIIYETLQSAVGASAMKRRPQSLNEVVTKSSSAFMPRKEEKRVDPLKARMKALAGITDK